MNGNGKRSGSWNWNGNGLWSGRGIGMEVAVETLSTEDWFLASVDGGSGVRWKS